MSSDAFSKPGAVDLSSLVNQANQQQAATNPASGGQAGVSGRFIVECDESNFNQLINDSMRYPVVIEFYSPEANAGEVSATLAKVAEESAGQILLARVNVAAAPMIAQAVGVQAVPTVIALIGGQVAPLFQGTKSGAEIEQLMAAVKQSAIANGITGRATGNPEAEAAGKAVDPKYQAAEAALDERNYELAVAEYEKILADNPNDAEAVSGKALAELLLRSMSFNPAEVEAQAGQSSDIQTQLNMADVEMIKSQPESAFNRLIGLIADSTDPEEKELVRQRLLDLFEVMGKADPVVLKARRKLSTALFS